VACCRTCRCRLDDKFTECRHCREARHWYDRAIKERREYVIRNNIGEIERETKITDFEV